MQHRAPRFRQSKAPRTTDRARLCPGTEPGKGKPTRPHIQIRTSTGVPPKQTKQNPAWEGRGFASDSQCRVDGGGVYHPGCSNNAGQDTRFQIGRRLVPARGCWMIPAQIAEFLRPPQQPPLSALLLLIAGRWSVCRSICLPAKSRAAVAALGLVRPRGLECVSPTSTSLTKCRGPGRLVRLICRPSFDLRR